MLNFLQDCFLSFACTFSTIMGVFPSTGQMYFQELQKQQGKHKIYIIVRYIAYSIKNVKSLGLW